MLAATRKQLSAAKTTIPGAERRGPAGLACRDKQERTRFSTGPGPAARRSSWCPACGGPGAHPCPGGGGGVEDHQVHHGVDGLRREHSTAVTSVRSGPVRSGPARPSPAATHRGPQDDAEVEAQRLPVLLEDLLLALGARLPLGLRSQDRRSAASPAPAARPAPPAPPLTAMAAPAPRSASAPLHRK